MILFSTFIGGSVLWLFSYLGFVSGLIFFTTFRTCVYLSTCRIIGGRNKGEKNNKIPEKSNKNGNMISDKELTLDQIIRKRKQEKKLQARQHMLEIKNRKKQLKLARKREINLNKHNGKRIKTKENTCKKIDNKISSKLREKPQKDAAKDKLKRERKIARQKKWVLHKNKIKKAVKIILLFLRKTIFTIICLAVLVTVIGLSLFANYTLNFGEVSLSSIAIYIVCFFVSSKFVKIVANFVLHLYNRGERKLNEKTI